MDSAKRSGVAREWRTSAWRRTSSAKGCPWQGAEAHPCLFGARRLLALPEPARRAGASRRVRDRAGRRAFTRERRERNVARSRARVGDPPHEPFRPATRRSWAASPRSPRTRPNARQGRALRTPVAAPPSAPRAPATIRASFTSRPANELRRDFLRSRSRSPRNHAHRSRLRRHLPGPARPPRRRHGAGRPRRLGDPRGPCRHDPGRRPRRSPGLHRHAQAAGQRVARSRQAPPGASGRDPRRRDRAALGRDRVVRRHRRLGLPPKRTGRRLAHRRRRDDRDRRGTDHQSRGLRRHAAPPGVGLARRSPRAQPAPWELRRVPDGALRGADPRQLREPQLRRRASGRALRSVPAGRQRQSGRATTSCSRRRASTARSWSLRAS